MRVFMPSCAMGLILFLLAAAPAVAGCADATGLVDLVVCHSPTVRKADEGLNLSYAKLLGVLTPGEREALKSSQQDWLRKRDADCLGGPAARFEACMQAATRARASALDRYDIPRLDPLVATEAADLPAQFAGTYGAYVDANCTRGSDDDITCLPPKELNGAIVEAKGRTVEVFRQAVGYKAGCSFVAKGRWNGSFVLASVESGEPMRSCQVRVSFRGRHLTLRTQHGCETPCHGWSDADEDKLSDGTGIGRAARRAR